MNRWIAIFLVCVCAAVLSACGGGGHRPVVSVSATCTGRELAEVVYTVPQGGNFTVSTALDGQHLETWIEPKGVDHTPVVVGVPAPPGHHKFTVTEDGRTVSVNLPNC